MSEVRGVRAERMRIRKYRLSVLERQEFEDCVSELRSMDWSLWKIAECWYVYRECGVGGAVRGRANETCQAH
jgi:hypothetical protein